MRMIATPHLSTCDACVSGTLHPGDEIRELDGESVENKSIESLQSILVIMRFVLLFSKKIFYIAVFTLTTDIYPRLICMCRKVSH